MQFHARTKNIVKIAARDAGRYAMHYVNLDGTNLVATDGRRLVVLPVTRDEHDADGFVTPAAITAACKAKHPRGTDERVLLANGDLRAPMANYLEPRPTGVGEFPRWRAVVPAFKPGDEGTVTVAFNAKYLAELAACLGDEDTVQITIKLGREQKDSHGRVVKDLPLDMTRDAQEPLLVRAPNNPDAYGVLMPITVDA